MKYFYLLYRLNSVRVARKTLVFLIFLICILIAASSSYGQNVTIPDANFKSYLVGNTSINTNGDSEIQVTEAEAFTGTINCSNRNISDLTGIEAFTGLTELLCFVNQLTSLDVSQNTALTSLNCYANQITSLDVSQNTALTSLVVSNNQLSSLDVTQNTALTLLNCSAMGLPSLDLSQNTALEILNCDRNNLTTLDVTNNNNLSTLVCYSNQLTSINLANNTALIDLNIADNQLNSLNISSNTSLQDLNCNANQITSLDVSSLPDLFTFYCGSNQLTSLDVTQNPDLAFFQCPNNQLGSLDISNNTNLETLVCTNIGLTSLDLSSYPNLGRLEVNDNDLTSLNVANGNNTNITTFNATGNSSLTCIRVDDVAYSTTNWTNIDAGVSFSDTYCDPNDPVNIPDTNFKAALLAIDPPIDTNDDDEISYAEAEAYGGSLETIEVNAEGISDFTGLEAFINLTRFQAVANPATSIDVSALTKLEVLNLYNVPLSSLDVSNNTSLWNLQFGGNSTFNTIDVSNNTAITVISCSNTSALTTINGIENLENLTTLYAQGCSIESLDLSNNDILNQIRVQNNSLTSLDVRNGNYESVTVFETTNNPGLTCINVDNPAYSTGNWTDIDNTTTFSLSCDPNEFVTILDANFKAALLAHNPVIDTNGDMEISYGEADAFMGKLIADDLGINNATGIEAFLNINDIDMENNNLTSIDLSNSTLLTRLNFNNNDLTSINVSNNPLVTFMNLEINNLTSLDVSNNPVLTDLYLQSNELTALDVTGNPNLDYLRIHNNDITSIDLSNNTSLNHIIINNNPITSIDLSSNPNLEFFWAQNGEFTSIDFSNNTSLKSVWLENCNNLTELDLSQNPQVSFLRVDRSDNLSFVDLRNGSNEILSSYDSRDTPNLTCIAVNDVAFANANWTSKDVANEFNTFCDPNEPIKIPDATFKSQLLANASINTTGDGEITYGEAEAFNGTISVQNLEIDELTGIEAFVNLTGLVAWRNNLTELNVTGMPNLTRLEVSRNQLTEIDLSNNSGLTILHISENQLDDLDIANNLLIEELLISDNNISTIDITLHTQIRRFIPKGNPITEINVSNQPELSDLRISGLDISSIDVTNNPELSFLEIIGMPIESVDLSNNPELIVLDARNGSLSTLDVSQNTKISQLRVSESQLTSIDISSNPMISNFEAANIPTLTSLNMANGANEDISNPNISDNPNLSCITVDDVDYAIANFTNVDNTVSFSTNCDNQSPVFENQVFDLPENATDGTLVGTLTATDPDGDDITYSDLTGTSVFSLASNGELTIIDASDLNFEDDPVLILGATATDDAVPSLSQTASIQINVTDANDVPTEIEISNLNIDESSPIGTVVGTLSSIDEDEGQSHTYSFASGPGDDDNASFTIMGDQLVSNEVFDFETKTSYSVVIQTDDGNGGVFTEESFTISINDISASITSFTIDNNSINENENEGTAIGTLSTFGEDLSGNFTYTLVSGEGDDDNGSFSVSNDQLLTSSIFDFEAKDSYNVRLMTDDGNGISSEATFIITIIDVNEGITVLNPIADLSLDFGFGAQEVDLSTVFEDLDGDEIDLDVESSEPAVATGTINNQILTIAEVGPGTTTFTITATDGSLTTSEEFAVTVNSAPLGLNDDINLKVYPNPVVELLHIESDQAITVRLTDLNGRTISSADGHSLKIDMSRLVSGTYLLTITDGQHQTTKRILKTN